MPNAEYQGALHGKEQQIGPASGKPIKNHPVEEPQQRVDDTKEDSPEDFFTRYPPFLDADEGESDNLSNDDHEYKEPLALSIQDGWLWP